MRPKRDHYEVLGVKKDASVAEIKKARRRKAVETHPDKGGDESVMAEINAAFDCLSNPERRLLYDQTGQDGLRAIDDEIRGVLFQAFTDALSKDVSDCLGHARKVIAAKSNELKSQRSAAVAAQKKLTKRRDKVSVKAGENLFHLVIDQELGRIAAGIGSLDRGLKVMVGALKELDAYSSSEKAEKEMVMMFTIGSASTSAGW